MSAIVMMIDDIRFKQMAKDDHQQQPTSKPMKKQAKLKCCFEPSRCTNGVYWLVDSRPFCRKHFEDLWRSRDSDVTKHRIVRLDGVEWG